VKKGLLRGSPFFGPAALADDAAAEADRYRVGTAAGLELCEEMADMAFHRLLREEEPDADLAVHEAVRDQLKHLDLTGRRLLLQLLHRSLKRDHLGDRVAARGDRLEPGRVLAIAREDLITLGCVHGKAIGARKQQL
jgi:RNA-binding protein YlmH